MPILLRYAIVFVVVAVAGCASPQASRYYSLANPQAEVAMANGSQPGGSRFAISVQSVSVPQSLDRAQIVVTDSRSFQLHPLNDYVWAAPLADEIKASLSRTLQSQLGVLDVPAAMLPANLPAWKIVVNVQRFDSVYNDHVLIDATWVMSPVNIKGAASRVCGAAITLPADVGISSLVASHRKALHALGVLMAARIDNKAIPLPEGMTDRGCSK